MGETGYHINMAKPSETADAKKRITMGSHDAFEKHLEQFASQCLQAANIAKGYYVKDAMEIDTIVVTGSGAA